jgi:hypothetical protein
MSLLNSLDGALSQPMSLSSQLDSTRQPHIPATPHADATLLHSSYLLQLFLGNASQAPPEVWQVLIGSGRAWSPALVKSIVGWAAGLASPTRSAERFGETGEREESEGKDKGLALILENALARWSDPQHVSRALLSEHRCA